MVQSKRETVHDTTKWRFAVNVGFFAGLLWGGVKIVEHYFHFTTLSPGFLIEPFYLHSFLSTWQGMLAGWLAFIVFSIVSALIYSVLLAKARGPWCGIWYGLAWWAVIFLILGPVTGTTKWIAYMDLNTVLTDLCLFLLWGLFIGYSITFEFTDERVREPYPGNKIPEPD
ncbi:YqhR family membrane protein [Paenibacillus filicis]|uniref:YqhR family membrane protein n=1 Tax=Paenibacillus gyeongsangnamensis TaxID=3388067 RepID=A0ABT4QIR9_9BACL|nr:YqhR family membrane protein [Paenibacillus filicis]MCZ8516748.1 YqhR family membrane protein [Paenibacillus filicis]